MTHDFRRCEDRWSEGSVFYLYDSLVVFPFLTLCVSVYEECSAPMRVGLTVGFGVGNLHIKERVLSRSPESACPD